MKNLVLVLAIFLTWALPAGRREAAVPSGEEFEGWYSAPGTTFLITRAPKDEYRLLDFDGARFHALQRESADRFTVQGEGSWKDARIEVSRPGSGGRPRLRIILADQRVVQATAAVEYPFDVEEVRVSSQDVTLSGPLLLPRVGKFVGTTGQKLVSVPVQLPAVTVLHGSGNSDRDNVWAFTFAWAMARAGFVTLFLDKRGSGASTGDWRTAGLDRLTDDATAGIDFLRRHQRVDPVRVGVLGLSQGGLVAGLATERRTHLAFAISVSSAPVPLFVQMRHELTQDLRRASLPEPAIPSVLAVYDLAASYSRSLSDHDWASYTDALAQLRGGPIARAAAGFPSLRTDWRWEWWRQVGDIDPLPAWRDFSGSALAIFGEDDETDNVPVRASVDLLNRAWRPEQSTRKRIRVYADRGHALVDPARKWIDPSILVFMTDWALQAVGGIEPAR